MPAYFTQKAFEKLKEKIKYLEKIERKKIEQSLKQAIGFGDLSENAAYTSAREEQELLEKQIIELKKDLKTAIIIKPNKKFIVQLNSVVWIEKINNKPFRGVVHDDRQKPNDKIKITLCSPNETDPFKNKISTNSPLGKALFGKKEGEVFSIKINDKNIEYKILKIE